MRAIHPPPFSFTLLNFLIRRSLQENEKELEGRGKSLIPRKSCCCCRRCRRANGITLTNDAMRNARACNLDEYVKVMARCQWNSAEQVSREIFSPRVCASAFDELVTGNSDNSLAGRNRTTGGRVCVREGGGGRQQLIRETR